MYWVRRFTYAGIGLAILIFTVTFLPSALNPDPPSPSDRRRDRQWVATSPYWLDRQACRWLSLCGLHHLRWDPPALPDKNQSVPDDGELRRIELRARWEAWTEEEELQSKRWEHVGRIRVKEKHLGQPPKDEGGKLKKIPEYVLAHAPLVHLYSEENFWPSDIAEHIQHMTPHILGGPAINKSLPLDLNDLDLLNGEHSMVFLTSDDDVESRPEWLHSHHGIPSPFDDGKGIIEGPLPAPADRPQFDDGTTWYDVDRDHDLHRISDPRKLEGHDRHPAPGRSRPSGPRRRRSVLPGHEQQPLVDPSSQPSTAGHKPDADGYSKAPAVLVLVDKGSGILDAFWFFFYSYNLGQTVLGVRYGNHVGDWEHCMVRFENGIPRALFLSEHSGGQAYAWNALEKYRPGGNESVAERPVVFSAVGSHAMYAMPGEHPYVLPFHMLRDITDRGPLWDPAKNNYAFWYDYVLDREEERRHHKHKGRDGVVEHNSLIPTQENPDLATGWFHFEGPWGDELYGLGDHRQWRLFGQYHYVTGPEGPKAKHLDRSKVCQTERCRILWSLDAGRKGTWYS